MNMDVRGKRVTVMGLGRFGGGIGVTQWLVRSGAVVTVTDRESAAKLEDSVRQLEGLPIRYRLGEHVEADFAQSDLVVASPAVKPDHHMLQAAAAAGVPVTTEIRLFIERCPAPIVGVTGTKGKSTTTALLGRMLETRHKTWVGGNIGRSLLHDLERIEREQLVVLELSSYMLAHLEPMRWSPHIAVITMITHDHVEWHGSHEAYVAAKANVLRFQTPQGLAVLNADDEASKGLAAQTPGRAVWFGSDARPFKLALPGAHNQLNAQAAFAAASELGVSFDQAQAAIADFVGLPHRLQLVHEAQGVRWFDDSIATIPGAAVAALGSFEPGRAIQIVGGYDKKLDMSGLCQSLADRAKAVLCIGDLGPVLAEGVRSLAANRLVRDCGTLEAAVAAARELARPGDVVLLSPGCASYDQFENFEQRGEAFARMVRMADVKSSD
jgi:UDP-N-acetylmuramoylalanine--D-glutamate ligase